VVAYLGFLVPALIIFLMPSSAPAQGAAAKHTV